jgi:hypothetical protein
MRCFLIILAAAQLGAAGPSWKTPGACTTPAGTLCRTLVYERTGWENRGWGFHAIERYREQITEAVRRDGTAVLRISHQGFKYFFVPEENYDRMRVVIPARRETFEVDHTLKEFRDLGGVWDFFEKWADNADCERKALAGRPNRGGKEVTVAGVRAIEYFYKAPTGATQRIAFAPALGCIAVRAVYSTQNSAGLPISGTELRLVSATLQEPDSGLFSIPVNYGRADSQKDWKYVSLDQFPGIITGPGFPDKVGDVVPNLRRIYGEAATSGKAKSR